MPAVALVVAAGRGERLGYGGPKAFVIVGAADARVERRRAAGRRGDRADRRRAARGCEAPPGTIGVAGGAQRSHSVRNALARRRRATDVVLVHDAARPLRDAGARARRAWAGWSGADAAIAAAPLADTVKEGEGGRVVRTLDRSRLWAVQTPQVFRRDVLERGARAARRRARRRHRRRLPRGGAGGTRAARGGPRTNFKVTTPDDLRLAELLLAERR